MRDALGSILDAVPPGWLVDRVGSRLNTFEASDTILLVGVPRTGSTWVMNLLSSLPGYKSVFEPMHPDWYEGAAELGLGPRPRVPAGATHEPFARYLEDVFTGRVSGRLGAYSRSPAQLWERVTADKLIVKSVRLTRSLPWMLDRFDLRNTYLLVRHPCAVVASQLRTGIRGHFTDPESPLDREPVLREARKALGQALTDPLDDKIDTISSQAELLALAWAVDYAVPLREGIEGADVIRYERLLEGADEALDQLFEPLGVEAPQAAREAYGRPSHTARPKGDETQEAAGPRWTEQLDREVGQRILEIVGWLGFDQFTYDSEDYAFPTG